MSEFPHQTDDDVFIEYVTHISDVGVPAPTPKKPVVIMEKTNATQLMSQFPHQTDDDDFIIEDVTHTSDVGVPAPTPKKTALLWKRRMPHC